MYPEMKSRVHKRIVFSFPPFRSAPVPLLSLPRARTTGSMNTRVCLNQRSAVRLAGSSSSSLGRARRSLTTPFAPAFATRPAHGRLHSLLKLCAKKKDDVDPSVEREAALQRREAELWARQSDLYDRALEELKELKAMYVEERSMWMSKEIDLMRENDALRSKLMYVVSNSERGLLTADWVDGTPASGEIPDVANTRDEQSDTHDDYRDHRDHRGGIDGRREMKVMDQEENLPKDSLSSSTIAEDFAAAFAAVEQGDILNDDVFVTSKGPNALLETEPFPAQATPKSPAKQPGEDDVPAEVPTGPPPSLTVGDDDIYWMNQLHVALVDEGYFPGDEDIDDFFFGSQTQSALLTFQACSGLEETGCTDMETWKALLGDDLVHKRSRDLTEDMNPLTEKPEALEKNREVVNKKPFAELFSAEMYEVKREGARSGTTETTTTTHVHDEKFFADGHVEVTDETVVSSSAVSKRKTWPTVLEGEGGQVVHALHVLLSDAGFYPNDDELQWWQFGDTTVAAIKTFQACNGMPETGTCNERLWKMLAGDDADPSIVDTLKSGKSDDEDLSLEGREGMVWLIGEQRWEDRRKLGGN